MIGLTYKEMMALKPCPVQAKAVTKLLGGAKTWNGKKISARQAVKAGVSFENLVWAASAQAHDDKEIERRLRLWLADCAAHVLHIYEKDYPKDSRPRDAIAATRAYARVETTDAGWAARAAAWAARAAASDAEEKWQLDRLVLWLSDKEPTDWNPKL